MPNLKSEHVVSIDVDRYTTFEQLRMFVALGEMLNINPTTPVMKFEDWIPCSDRSCDNFGDSYTRLTALSLSAPVAVDLSKVMTADASL